MGNQEEISHTLSSLKRGRSHENFTTSSLLINFPPKKRASSVDDEPPLNLEINSLQPLIAQKVYSEKDNSQILQGHYYNINDNSYILKNQNQYEENQLAILEDYETEGENNNNSEFINNYYKTNSDFSVDDIADLLTVI